MGGQEGIDIRPAGGLERSPPVGHVALFRLDFGQFRLQHFERAQSFRQIGAALIALAQPQPQQRF